MLFKHPTLKKNLSEISTHAGSKSNCLPEKQFSIFCVLIFVFFFIKKKINLQVGVSGWRGGGADSKEYGFICIILCIPGCLQLHFVALVILRGLKKRFNCTYFFVEL